MFLAAGYQFLLIICTEIPDEQYTAGFYKKEGSILFQIVFSLHKHFCYDNSDYSSHASFLCIEKI